MFMMHLQARDVNSSEAMSAKTEDSVAHDVGWQALGPAIACTVLATIIVSLRWYARHRIAQCVGLDDYVVLISLALSWTMTAVIAAEVNGGVGVYAGQVDVQTIAKLVIVANILWILIVNITKASILIQYLRIFSSRLTRICCYILMVSLLPAVCWAVFGNIFLCHPVAKLWNPALDGNCMDARQYWLSVAGIDIGLDFLVLLLPLPAITALHLPRKEKLGLLLVFSLGFFVCLVSVIRLLSVLISANQGHYVASGIWAIIWSAVEANVGIICASLLALKPLIAEWFPNLVEERKPPRHSMHLPPIETRDILRQGPCSRSASGPPPATPSTLRSSKEDATLNSAWSSRFGSAPPLSELEDLTVIEPEDVHSPVGSHRPPGRERMSLFDMLQEDEEEARARIQRKSSSFAEHV